MCLILFAWEAHPKYKLILGANRDEFLARSTQSMHQWEGAPTITAGKDLEKGGTWLGVNEQKQFAALTNYREPQGMPMPNQPSRGELVAGFLKDMSSSPQAYLSQIGRKADEYGGFNILAGNADGLFHFSNRENKINEISAGVHGLSNALLDTEWPKVKKGKEALKKLTSQSEVNQEQIFELLKDDIKAPDKDLPQTGISLEWERVLSPMFIKAGNYGTRCSTAILWDYEGNIEIAERTYDLTEPKTTHFTI